MSSACKTPNSSSNRKSVILHKWWLIKVERESKLGIGGYAKREYKSIGSRARRVVGSASSIGKSRRNTENKVFYSSAIEKRVDNNTVETVDGFTITLIGCIHRSRTLSSGFSPQVCDHFLSGFPFNWEGYAGNFSNDKFERSLPISFDDLPLTRARDILMSTARESEACAFTSIILKDILKQCSNQSASYEMELDHQQDGRSLRIIQDLGNSRETEAARVSSRAGTLPESCVELFDLEREKCDTTKRVAMRTPDGYPLRSRRMKKSN